METHLQDRGGEIWLAVKLIQRAQPQDPLGRPVPVQSRHDRTTVPRTVGAASFSSSWTGSSGSSLHATKSSRTRRPITSSSRDRDICASSTCRTCAGHGASSRRRSAPAPDFVPAISGLARTYQREWLLLARGDSELLAEAERLARLALEIDPDDARGYRELGVCTLYAGRFDESLEALRQAEMRNPQYADLLVGLCGRAAARLRASRRLRRSPSDRAQSALPGPYWWTAGGANFHLQRYAEAIECMSRMRDQSPAYRLLAASWAMLGDRATGVRLRPQGQGNPSRFQRQRLAFHRADSRSGICGSTTRRRCAKRDSIEANQERGDLNDQSAGMLRPVERRLKAVRGTTR